MSQVARRYHERGLKALATGDLEGALEALRSAVELAPAFGSARIAYAIALARYGDAPRAATLLRGGIPRASSPVAAAAMWATLGDVLTVGGDFFAAEEAFREAGRVPGYEARAAAGLARVYARLQRFPEMSTQLRLAAKISGDAERAGRG
ncbi:MAG: hypothetical protein H6708_34715 [Kofleriaceae bacterium]|nr:hypothetical protein [Kofleriaceae bacterium]MCB9565568.1 hypothetical protein [Kofleriaceae bacterium]